MNYFLIGGAPITGKTEAITRLTKCLLSKGFTVAVKIFPFAALDFKIILKGFDHTVSLLEY